MKAFVLFSILFIPFRIIAQPIYQTSNIAGSWAIAGTHISNSVVSPSTGYSASNQSPSASGTNNAQLQSCSASTTSTITSPSISTSGKSNIRVAFGRYEESDFGGQAVKLEWSTDGGTIWNLVNGDVTTPSVLNSWNTLFFNLPAGANNQANLKFRFSFTSDAQNCGDNGRSFRIDDFIVGANFKLPIQLLSFEVIPNKKPLLSWTTLSELNNDYFSIEHSQDGIHFAEIKKVKGQGTTDKRNDYSYIDLSPSIGINYYRLIQVDDNGISTAYPAKSVMVSLNDMILFPTIFDQDVTLQMPPPYDKSVTWVLYDAFGRTILTGNSPGQPVQQIQLSAVQAGTYLLAVLSPSGQKTQRLIKL